MYNSLCILRCVRKKNVHRPLYFKHGTLYRIWTTETPARFSYLVGIMLSPIKCYYLTSVTLVMAHFIFK